MTSMIKATALVSELEDAQLYGLLRLQQAWLALG